MTCAMASTEACGGPSGNSLPLIQTVSAGAAPGTEARCANAASVRPAAIIPAKARRENISLLLWPDVSAESCAERRCLLESTGREGRIDRGSAAHLYEHHPKVRTSSKRKHSIDRAGWYRTVLDSSNGNSGLRVYIPPN